MFATPIIYPLSQVPAKWTWLEWLNPMAIPIEFFRWCLLGLGTLSTEMVLASCLYTVILLFAGLIAFQKASRSAVDVV